MGRLIVFARKIPKISMSSAHDQFGGGDGNRCRLKWQVALWFWQSFQNISVQKAHKNTRLGAISFRFWRWAWCDWEKSSYLEDEHCTCLQTPDFRCFAMNFVYNSFKIAKKEFSNTKVSITRSFLKLWRCFFENKLQHTLSHKLLRLSREEKFRLQLKLARNGDEYTQLAKLDREKKNCFRLKL